MQLQQLEHGRKEKVDVQWVVLCGAAGPITVAQQGLAVFCFIVSSICHL